MASKTSRPLFYLNATLSCPQPKNAKNLHTGYKKVSFTPPLKLVAGRGGGKIYVRRHTGRLTWGLINYVTSLRWTAGGGKEGQDEGEERKVAEEGKRGSEIERE